MKQLWIEKIETLVKLNCGVVLKVTKVLLFVKKVKTELGFCGELKRSRFEALRAVSRGKPMVLMR